MLLQASIDSTSFAVVITDCDVVVSCTAKATDENLTSEDWAAIMDICDRVLGDAANGAQQSVQALIKRLAHRNANVQLYTLEVSRCCLFFIATRSE